MLLDFLCLETASVLRLPRSASDRPSHSVCKLALLPFSEFVKNCFLGRERGSFPKRKALQDSNNPQTTSEKLEENTGILSAHAKVIFQLISPAHDCIALVMFLFSEFIFVLGLCFLSLQQISLYLEQQSIKKMQLELQAKQPTPIPIVSSLHV